MATLVVGQTLTSESDVPFEPFTAAFAVGSRVTAASFKSALGFDPSRQAVLGPAARFFQNAAAASDDPGGPAGLRRPRTRDAAQPHRSDLTQAFVRGEGIVEVPFFLFGRLAAGPLVGLRSIAIET